MMKLFVLTLMLVWPISEVLGFEISTAYQDTAPKFMLDEQGQASGICIDIFAAIEKQDPQIRFSRPNFYTPIKRIFNAIEHGNLMVYCGAGFNKTRATKMLYSQVSLYAVSTLLVISKKNQNPYTSLQALKNDADLDFFSINGTSNHKLLGKMGFNMRGHYIKTLTQGLGLAIRDRYNVFAYHSLGLKYAMSKSSKWQGLKFLPLSLRDYQHWMVFSRELKKAQLDRINLALKEIKGKKIIDEILKNYR